MRGGLGGRRRLRKLHATERPSPEGEGFDPRLKPPKGRAFARRTDGSKGWTPCTSAGTRSAAITGAAGVRPATRRARAQHGSQREKAGMPRCPAVVVNQAGRIGAA